MAVGRSEVFDVVVADWAVGLGGLVEGGTSWLTTRSIPLPAVLVSGASLLLLLVSAWWIMGAVSSSSTEADKPYPSGRYDAESARRYFRKRGPAVLRRAVRIASAGLGFGASLVVDKLRDKIEENADRRASELASILTRLGPTFIKIGQTLSIRTDLLPPAYIRGLRSLQDRVPAFDTAIARTILEDEWGVSSVDSVVDLVGDNNNNNSGQQQQQQQQPVAAASLGQVYRARLKETDQEVAIKVQRPDIEERVALDMYLLRIAGAVLKKWANINSDAVETVDAWGVGFVDELDYRAEAANSERFLDGISSTPLSGVVFSPRVLPDLSTRRVLTTEWVDGERLDRSSSDDVTILCSIAMNTYLTMMLELGTLHCDPVSERGWFLTVLSSPRSNVPISHV